MPKVVRLSKIHYIEKSLRGKDIVPFWERQAPLKIFHGGGGGGGRERVTREGREREGRGGKK